MYSDRHEHDIYPRRPDEVDAVSALRGYRCIQLLLGLIAALFVLRILLEDV